MFHLLFFLVKGVVRVIVFILLSLFAVNWGTEALAELEKRDLRTEFQSFVRNMEKPDWLSTPEGDLRVPKIKVTFE